MPIDPRSVPVRFSTLHQFAKSPLHYWHAVQGEREETLSMRIGKGVHAMLFEQPYAVWDAATSTGKAAPRNGAEWEKFKTAHADAAILNRSEYVDAGHIVASLRRSELAMRLMEGAVCEQRIDWSWMGRSCRSTPDIRTNAHVVDLKTARTAEPDRFGRQSHYMHYHAQLAFYLDAVRESGLGAPSEAFIIAVESSPPYPVTVLRLTERAIEQGRRMCRLWFERLLACEAAGEWPPYVQSVVDLDIPDDAADLIFADGENSL